MNFKYYLGTYEKKDGSRSLRLKMETSKSDVQYIDSGISILKTQWDAGKQRVKRHPLEEQKNGLLSSLLSDIQRLHYDNKGASAKRLHSIYKSRLKHDGSSFIDFYYSLMEEMKLKGKVRTATIQLHYIKKLQKFSSHVSFSDLSPQFAKDYETWMLKRGNKINTIASNFKALSAALNKAVKLGLIKSNPIKGYRITTENTEKESLTFNEILAIQDLIIPDRFKGMAKARDMFLFSFYTAGMRFSDLCRLRWVNIRENEIIYTMNKSRSRAGAKRSIPLAPKTIEILDMYKGNDPIFVFPPLYGYDKKSVEEIEYKIYISNNSLNRSLKILGGKLGFNSGLSMHSAKHSFTSYALKNDVSIVMISKLLGHTKLSTTQHYLKDFYHKEQTDEINRLFGG